MAVLKIVSNVISNSTVVSNGSTTNYIESDFISLPNQIQCGLTVEYIPQLTPTPGSTVSVDVYTSYDGTNVNIDTIPYLSYTQDMQQTIDRHQFTYTFDVTGLTYIKFKVNNNSNVNLTLSQSSIITKVV